MSGFMTLVGILIGSVIIYSCFNGNGFNKEHFIWGVIIAIAIPVFTVWSNIGNKTDLVKEFAKTFDLKTDQY